MFKPTPAQEPIIDHFNGHALVIAGPGSGKTVTLVAHVKKLILENNVSPDDIWVMVFNRDIASKLSEKIRNELGEKSPQVTTIHSFILQQIINYGRDLLGSFQIADDLGECGMENLLWRPISQRLKSVYGITKTPDGKRLDIRHVRGNLWRQLIDYWLISRKPTDTTNDLFEKFNHEVERYKRIYRIVFLDELALKFCDALKANPSFRREVSSPRIVIDEFQDLNPTEHGIIQQFSQVGSTFVVFGDDDQAVNDFRRAHADYIRQFREVYKPKLFPLARDKRCPKEILDLADAFVTGLPRFDKPAGFAPHQGRVDILCFVDDQREKQGIAEIVTKYLSLSSWTADKPEVLVLCGSTGVTRTKTRVSEMIEILKNVGVSDVTGEQKDDPLDNEWGLAFKSLLKLVVEGNSPVNLAAWLAVAHPPLMKIISDYIEEEERKGNSLDFLMAIDRLEKYNPEIRQQLSDLNNVKSKIATGNFDPAFIMNVIPENLAGKDESEMIIRTIWENCRTETATTDPNHSGSDKQELGAKFLQQAIRYFGEDVRKSNIGRIHVTTYRKAKGLEADLVIVTSVDSSDFCDDDQRRRLLYVAATRSKKDLILTFAQKRTKARRFTRGRAQESKGNPMVFRSPLIPVQYISQEYSPKWLANWIPV